MKPFDKNERREFFDAHIPHRLTALLSPIRRQQDAEGYFSGRGDLYCFVIESSYIMLRVFIEFLGVESKKDGKNVILIQRTREQSKGQKRARDTDVMLDCFDLPLADPADFEPHRDLIARVHDGLSKSTAHFTFKTEHYFDAGRDFLPAVDTVLRVLHSHLFEPLGEYPKTHCDLPKIKI